MQLIEEIIIDAIELTLKNNMTTTLSEAETAAGDGLVLDDIEEYQKGWMQLLNRKKYPVIAIQPAPVRLEKYQNGYDGTYEFDITVAVTDNKTEDLFKKVIRYPEVIREIIQRNPTLNGKCTDAEILSIDYLPAATGLSIGIVTISVQKEIR